MIIEDKAKICKMLLPVLQQTSNLYDLVDLEYERLDRDVEIVTATFANGFQKRANVSIDSGTAMIRDIIKQIV